MRRYARTQPKILYSSPRVTAVEYPLLSNDETPIEIKLADNLRNFVRTHLRGRCKKFYLHIYLGFALAKLSESSEMRYFYPGKCCFSLPLRIVWLVNLQCFVSGANYPFIARRSQTLNSVNKTISKIRTGKYDVDFEKLSQTIEGSNTTFCFFVNCVIKADTIIPWPPI